MDPIQIFVIRKDAGWCVKVRETSSHAYTKEMAAIQAAMSEARNLASASFECEVAMRMLTCPFGPKGMGKAFLHATGDADQRTRSHTPQRDPNYPRNRPKARLESSGVAWRE